MIKEEKPQKIFQKDYRINFIERPEKLKDFIGQNHVKKQLTIAITAAKTNGKQLDHILFYGPAGLGKTTLAQIVAKEMNSNIKIISAPTIEKSGDLAAILSSIRQNDFIFIDEIHRLKINLEEILFPAMEDYHIDVLIGKGPTAKSIKINLPPFTLIGATTLAGNISKPLRSRFGLILKLEYYSIDSLNIIIKNAFQKLGFDIDSDSAIHIARCSRGTPRIALHLVKRVCDFATYKNKKKISVEIVKETLLELGINENGLDSNDIKLLKTIIEDYKGGPVGVNALAVSIGEDTNTVEDFYEPYLIQMGYIKRTTKGRVANQKAYELLGLNYIEKNTLF
ncbi:MAG: Holliday junction branch migration DNA helicase RuvB [Exilispira sp.]